MSEPILCDCGTVLVEEVTEEGVKPVGGDPIPFRRTTDYVICSNCYSVYNVRTLAAGGSLTDSFIEKLERLASAEGGEEAGE